MYRDSPRCAETHRDSPRLTEMYRDVPRCTDMCRDVPRCTQSVSVDEYDVSGAARDAYPVRQKRPRAAEPGPWLRRIIGLAAWGCSLGHADTDPLHRRALVSRIHTTVTAYDGLMMCPGLYPHLPVLHASSRCIERVLTCHFGHLA